MSGKRIGYKRVSTIEQNPDSQLMSIELDRVFTDIVTGYSTKDRHELAAMKQYVRDGDIIFVECMDRLGRDGYDLDNIVEFLLKKGVQIHFVREGIILGKKNDLMSKLAYDMMKAFIHFFSKLAKERQRIGIEKAKAEGKYKGSTSKWNESMRQIIIDGLISKDSKSKIAKDLGISRVLLYKYLKKIESNEI